MIQIYEMKQDVSLRQTFSFFFFIINFHKNKFNQTHHVAKTVTKFHKRKKKHKKNLLKQNPVSWQVSADGQRMIGHMILRKNIDGEDILGLKIVGGQHVSPTRKGAVIEKVKRGSIADQEGHLKPGKNIHRKFVSPIRTFASSFILPLLMFSCVLLIFFFLFSCLFI